MWHSGHIETKCGQIWRVHKSPLHFHRRLFWKHSWPSLTQPCTALSRNWSHSGGFHFLVEDLIPLVPISNKVVSEAFNASTFKEIIKFVGSIELGVRGHSGQTVSSPEKSG